MGSLSQNYFFFGYSNASLILLSILISFVVDVEEMLCLQDKVI